MCDMIKLKILESHCLPILLYGADCGIFDDNLVKMLNCCWNNVIRKVFGYHRWESVKSVLCCLNKLNVHYLIGMRRIAFIKNLFVNMHICNPLRGFLVKYIHSNEFQSLLHKFNVDFNLSFSDIKKSFHDSFKTTCLL